MNELRRVELTKTGECEVGTLCVLEIADIVVSAGCDPRSVRLRGHEHGVTLYKSECTLAGGQKVVLR